MKALIWIGTIAVGSILDVVLGLTVKITSPIIEMIVVFALARYICKKFDERRSNKAL